MEHRANPMPAKAFSDAFPFESFRALVASLAKPGDGAYHTAIETLVEPALRAVLQDRLSRGELRPVPNSDGHDTPFLSAWNGLVSGDAPDGDPDACMDDVVGAIAGPTVGRWAFHVDKAGDPAALLAQERGFYARLAARMDAGEIGHHELQSQLCEVTGESYWVRFENWNPTFVIWQRDGSLLPMRPGEPPSVKEFEVTFPTGELLVTDWFRVPGFDAAVDAKRPNLGSEKGKEEAARRYAEMGLVSIHVGNSNPDIFERDGVIVLGEGEGKPVGSVGTGYWGVSVIDRARLVEIVSAELGPEGARREVDAMTARLNVSRITVEPGTYWLYMTGEKGNFAGLFKPDGVDLDGLQPYFALSPRRLDLDAEPSMPAP